MLELLDPANIDSFAYEEGFLDKIKQHSLLPNHRIGWNYCMDYSWLLMRLSTLALQTDMRIIDIGCGPGAIHGYLEDTKGLDIIGIDLHRWERDYVDIVGNFLDDHFRRQHGLDADTIDIIIATSAFEHNRPEVHQQIVEVCMRCLRPGGHLITTTSSRFIMIGFMDLTTWGAGKGGAPIEKFQKTTKKDTVIGLQVIHYSYRRVLT